MPDSRHAQVLIIGGGVIGLSIAFHCAGAGLDVALLERGELGCGTSSRTARVVRGYFPRRVPDSALAVRSLTDYHNFAAETGVDPGLEQTGFLVVLSTAEEVDTLERELADQRAVGVEAQLITSARASNLNPWLDPAGVAAAVWSPQAFSCNPEAIIGGYAQAARQLGARLLPGTAVISVDALAGRVTTTVGDFTADLIVCAAGPWSGTVAEMAGMRLPVAAQPSELMITDPVRRDRTPPFTLHLGSALRMHRLGDSLLIGLEGIPKGGEQRAARRRAVAEEVARHYPELGATPLHTAWTGALDVAEQRTAFIGRGTGAHERLLYAAGFSGRGLCQAPMTGRIIRDLCLGIQPDTDISGYSHTRLHQQEFLRPEESQG